MVENFTTRITPFGLERNTFVYLPDDWQTSGKRYPVVYMFDGHNLFFDSTATFGTCWGLKEYMDAHPQAIIVANFSDDLANLPSLQHSYVARQTHARGIIEGVLHFRGKGKAQAPWQSAR